MIVADTHVHLYPDFNIARFFDAALDNFVRLAPDAVRWLCLTDVEQRQSDVHLCENTGAANRWRFERHPDGRTVRAIRDDDACIWVFPGRQIISSEGIELLALNTRWTVSDRCFSLSNLVDQSLEAGAIPVLPWGFGKWTGQRGRIVDQLARNRWEIVLADSGNRWRGGPEPLLLKSARREGRPIWAGSDPLPLPPHEVRAGSYGVVADQMTMDDRNPGATFRDVYQRANNCRIIGARAAWPTFITDQWRMQRRKQAPVRQSQ